MQLPKFARFLCYVIACFLILVILASCSSAQPGTMQNVPDGRIVFVSNRDGNKDIYVIKSDGSGLRKLTKNPDDEDMPSGSPDGRYIAFVRGKDIYFMESDGSNPAILSPDGCCGALNWSPDSTVILYGRKLDERILIHAISIGSPKDIPLTYLMDNRSLYLSPAWSPDGQQIAFIKMGTTPESDGLIVARVDGRNFTNLSQNSTNQVLSFAWSPNGKQIAYVVMDYGTLENSIYVINVDGTRNYKLLAGVSAVWSPDGSKIAFLNKEIYVVNPDGTSLKQITNNLNGYAVPVWSPDGSKIAFVGSVNGIYNLYVVNLGDNYLSPLLKNWKSSIDNISWLPSPKRSR